MADWDESLSRGELLATRQYYHAAIEHWTTLLQTSQEDTEKLGELYNNLGKAYIQVGHFQKALHYFTAATSCTPNTERRVRYHMNVAITYRRTFEYDKAQRMLTQIMSESGSHLSPGNRAILHANLAVVQGLTGFYADGLNNTQASLELFESVDVLTYHPTLYNNLGALSLYLGDYIQAKEYLLTALRGEDGPHLSTISELSRLYMHQGAMEESMFYAQKALPYVWSSIINYDKDDIATLCLLLGQLTHFMGQRTTSLRLLEKSQLLFGQLGLWREWQQVQSLADEWSGVRNHPIWTPEPEHFAEIQKFVLLLDALNAQELIHNQFSRLLDARVLFAKSLATVLQVPIEAQNSLIHACRFADYGLTTVEPDVVQNPARSRHSLQQYQLHPKLSVDMLHMAAMPEEVSTMILNHHERVDGSGYPNRRRGSEIPLMAQVLAVADSYSEAVFMNSKSHSVAMNEILVQSSTAFDPNVVHAFVSLFQ